MSDSPEDLTREEIEAAWGDEALRHLAELESGEVTAIPGEEVMAQARKIAGL